MKSILRILAGVGLAGAAFAAAPAFAQAPSPQTWFKVCAKQADVDVCNTQLQVIAQNGQLVTAVSLLDIKGKTNRKIFQVSVPPGRLLQPGIAMAIDGGEAQKIDYSVCFADRCIAEAELTDKLIASLKKGGALTLTSVNFQRQQNPVNVTLSGFTGAFDGEPIQQTDAEARQKEVEDWVAKNKAEFEKKILEAQEKAKTGN